MTDLCIVCNTNQRDPQDHPFTDRSPRTPPALPRNKIQERFDSIHTNGPKRHPDTWLTANIAAVHAIWEFGFDPSDLRIKALVSSVTLRVLDAVENTR